MNPYLILGTQRSGTTVVHIALYNHPQVSALYDEAQITPLFTSGLSTFTFGNNNSNEEKCDVRRLFETLCTLQNKEGVDTIGMKIANSNPFEIRALKQKLLEQIPDIKIVYIYRSDLTAQYGSLVKGKQTNQFHSWDEKLKSKNTIKINLFKFKIYLMKYILSNLEYESYTKSFSTLTINYEEDILQGDFKKIFDFLKIQKIVTNTTKKISPPAQEYINNYDKAKIIEEKLKNQIKNNRKHYERRLLFYTRLTRFFRKLFSK